MSIRAKIMREEREPYYIGEVSSSEEEQDAKSSEDELEVFMKGDLQRENEDGDSIDSCEDEFEKEMKMELDAAMKSHESAGLQQDSKTEDLNTPNIRLAGSSKQKKACYDEDYFSSGSEEDEDKVGGQASKSDDRRKMLDDVELFYDPEMDDEDEQWVNRQRQKHRQKGNLDDKRKSGSTSETKGQVASSTVSSTARVKSPEKPLSSDAILSCPACLSMLCIDCQRHEIYNNQYRAMFVMNCHIVVDEVLRYEIPNQTQKPGKKKRKRNQSGKLVAAHTGSETENNQPGMRECYKPVRCTECNTEVAVYDEDEVYHFFNIVASHA